MLILACWLAEACKSLLLLLTGLAVPGVPEGKGGGVRPAGGHLCCHHGHGPGAGHCRWHCCSQPSVCVQLQQGGSAMVAMRSKSLGTAGS